MLQAASEIKTLSPDVSNYADYMQTLEQIHLELQQLKKINRQLFW